MNKTGLGIAVPEILIPDERVNMKKWSVVACDQYTNDRGYWTNVSKIVGGAPSTLHIMIPEVYLEDDDVQLRISRSKEIMRQYLEDSVLNLLPAGFVLVERYIDGIPRKGLMVTVDLEEYDYDINNHPLVRATEQTLMERIPPRVEIRRGADVEMPHVLLLMDDRDNTVIEPLDQWKESFPKLYDFELMQDGGRIAGYFVNQPEAIDSVMKAVGQLPTWDGMRFCVGDGNHSLATAKVVWDQVKENMDPEERETSPLRYALVELINLYDPALKMLPIHRVIRNVNISNCVRYIADALNKQGCDARLVFSRRRPSAQNSTADQTLFFSGKDGAGRIEVHNPTHPMLIGELQPILESYITDNPGSRLEYVHGDDVLEAVSNEYDTLALTMPAMSKDDFFGTVIQCGVLPKKTFSLGEANEKRYYLECRLLARPAQPAVEEEPENAMENENPREENTGKDLELGFEFGEVSGEAAQSGIEANDICEPIDDWDQTIK